MVQSMVFIPFSNLHEINDLAPTLDTDILFTEHWIRYENLGVIWK